MLAESRSAESHGPTSYFISKFATIQTPKKNVCDYEERVRRSVVGEFCRIQAENGTYIMPSTYALRSFVSDLVLKKFIVVGKTSRQT